MQTYIATPEVKDCTALTSCLACGGSELTPVFSLGEQPLANAFSPVPDTGAKRYPLAMVKCRFCRHLQLTHSVSPAILFSNYQYTSANSAPMMDFFSWFAARSMNTYRESCATINGVEPQVPRVLDIGCNDGSQLDAFRKYGCMTYGVDPARNICEETGTRHSVVCDFFSEGLFRHKFDIITIQNAFAHTRDQKGMLRAAASSLETNGLLYIVTSQGDMLLNGEFDTIYHEHLSFYNISSMAALCTRIGVTLVDAVRHHVHGNSYIFTIANRQPGPADMDRIRRLITAEHQSGLYSDQSAAEFGTKAERSVSTAKSIERTAMQFGIPFVGYTAPAKGTVFINESGIRPKFVLDSTRAKHGKYVPGTDIPILDESAIELLAGEEIVYFVIFAWNVAEEVKRKIRAARPGRDDRFLTTFPIAWVTE